MSWRSAYMLGFTPTFWTIYGVKSIKTRGFSMLRLFSMVKAACIESDFCPAQDFRRIATRYDTPATNFLASLRSALELVYLPLAQSGGRLLFPPFDHRHINLAFGEYPPPYVPASTSEIARSRDVGPACFSRSAWSV